MFSFHLTRTTAVLYLPASQKEDSCVQNAAARLFSRTSCRAHNSPVLASSKIQNICRDSLIRLKGLFALEQPAVRTLLNSFPKPIPASFSVERCHINRLYLTLPTFSSFSPKSQLICAPPQSPPKCQRKARRPQRGPSSLEEALAGRNGDANAYARTLTWGRTPAPRQRRETGKGIRLSWKVPQ